MTTAAISSATSSVAQSVWQTLQLQQAQRNADQARQNVHALQSEAAQAQIAADQADLQARSLGQQAQQAQVVAAEADQSLKGMQSVRLLQTQLTQRAQNVHQAVQGLQPAPVINVQGQVTGKVVNVKA